MKNKMKSLITRMSYKQYWFFMGKLAQDEFNFRVHVLSMLNMLGEQLNELSRMKGLPERDYNLTEIQDAVFDEVDSENSTS